jgi:hypothetical protein
LALSRQPGMTNPAPIMSAAAEARSALTGLPPCLESPGRQQD